MKIDPNPKNIGTDMSKKENQVGCGYCAKEMECPVKRELPKVNYPRLGWCKRFVHYSKMQK